MTEFVLPPYAAEGAVPDPGECRSCHAPVFWIETQAGKRAICDPDGTSHWATCPHAPAWRKARSEPLSEPELFAGYGVPPDERRGR